MADRDPANFMWTLDPWNLNTMDDESGWGDGAGFAIGTGTLRGCDEEHDEAEERDAWIDVDEQATDSEGVGGCASASYVSGDGFGFGDSPGCGFAVHAKQMRNEARGVE